ncbi:MAG: ABC transporter permease subunit [Desulfobulbaceae bacterium]|nr:ABC transporter permease subunit [Desulfobulbaceae bacterium]
MLSHLTSNLDIWVEGLTNTVMLTVLGIVIGFFVAIPIALALLKNNKTVSHIAYGYVYIMRGTPLLIQVFIIYYGLGQFHQELKDIGLWWFFRDPFNCGVTAFVLNSAAYQAEILRGGIQAVPAGVVEGGSSLGLSRFLVLKKIVMPIMLARMLPAFGNEFVLLLKASAIASIITVRDVMGQARLLYAETFDLSVFYIAAVNYLLIVLLIEALWRKLENRNLWLQYSGC